MVKLLLCLPFAIFCSTQLSAQFKIRDSCSDFTLKIEAENLKSDSIRLVYNDCEDINYRDTFVLSNGKVSIRGKINRASEGMLYTNIRSLWMDGPRVIRFIIEPGNMILHFTILNDTARGVVIKGSSSQKQKVAWETDHAYLLQARDINENKLGELLGQKKMMDSIKFKNEFKVIGTKRDSIRKLLVTEALKYIKKNPDSYFSGYLLNYYKRHIPTNTLETYFSNLDSRVINSDLGKRTLDELFKLTDDWAFRQKFTDSITYESLKKINTIYDVSLPDAESTETSFSKFKGNVLLIDFWASWCKPCIRNVPGLKKLNTEMKDRPFKIISVSIDSDKDAWQRAIKKYGFRGIHLYDDKGFLSTFYKVLWVPRYVLVNSDGSVANMDAPFADNTFNITGEITGPHTGIIVLYYTDTENRNAVDSATVKSGRFQFTGSVNRISDAYLWTDTSNHNFSDRSVVRFLLEPKNIHIVYDKGNATIRGSDSQEEKENFDKEKSAWVIPKNKFRNEIDSLHRLFKYRPDPRTKERIDELYGKIYFINERIKPIDMEYIRTHSDSYLSGFLLSSYKRGLSIDTLQTYYSSLSARVKSSGEGKKVIRYIYPLTNNGEMGVKRWILVLLQRFL